MNCPQCQTVNGPGAAFCGNCGARLAPAEATVQTPTAAPADYNAPGGPAGHNAPGGPAGHNPPGAPAGYNPPGGPAGHNAPGGPAGYGSPAGYGGPAGNDAPGGYPPPPPPPASGYGPPASGYGPPASGYGPPASGYVPPAPGYGPPGGQGPNGYPQGQYQPGQSGPFVRRSSGLPPVNFDLTRLSTVDKVVAVATLVTMISLWLPWFSATYRVLGVTSTGTISGTGDHGWLWLEFILALALLAYLAARAAWDQLPFRLPVAHERLLIAGTGLQFVLILIGFFATPSTDGVAGLSISWDFGAILALLASIAAAGPVIYPAVRSYLDSRNAAGGARRY